MSVLYWRSGIHDRLSSSRASRESHGHGVLMQSGSSPQATCSSKSTVQLVAHHGHSAIRRRLLLCQIDLLCERSWESWLESSVRQGTRKRISARTTLRLLKNP